VVSGGRGSRREDGYSPAEILIQSYRLFRGERGGDLSESVYQRAWQGARLAFTPAMAASPLAGRPYDLRHACLSVWLNAGVDPTQVAEWAGNSVEVLLRVYAKCIHGRDRINRKRIEDALRDDGDGEEGR
jgi:integrase